MLLVCNSSFVQLQFDVIVTIEIEFTREGQIRRDIEIAGTAQNSVMEVDVVLLDRFVALVERLMLFALDNDPIKAGVMGFDIFGKLV